MKNSRHFYKPSIFLPIFLISNALIFILLDVDWKLYFLIPLICLGVYIVIYILLMILYLIMMLLFKKRMSARTRHYFPKGLTREVATLLRIKLKVRGKENIPKNTNYAIIANHQSMMDILAIVNAFDIPVGFVAKKSLGKIPLLGIIMKNIDCEFIDRKDLKQSIRAINNASEKIKNQQSMVIFPEGMRSKGDEMGEFKQGSFRIATKVKAPILPVTIKNSYKVVKNFPFKRTYMEVTIHKPIDYEEYKEIDKQQLPKHVQDIVESGL